MHTQADEELVAWLATATGGSREHVAAELAEGDARRRFVVRELVDAGYRGSELLDRVVRLTGLDERGARKLISIHTS
jgi:hypothetical protein